MALVGPYSAGKSLLVAALLGMSHDDAELISAATPHTTQISRYQWRQRELLDLPGTLSGLDEHDQVARQGVRSADALVIVSTVELPGEDEAAAIRQLLDRDGFRGRCVLAVNKAASENSDRDVIRAELEHRIGSSAGVALVFTDARDFLDSINEPDLTEDDRSLLSADSGIADLENAVESLLSRDVSPRRAAQLHEAARLLGDGLALWEPTVEEQVVDTTAARAQAALDAARKDAAESVDRALAALADGIRAIGARLAAAVDATTGTVPEGDVNAASADEVALQEEFVMAVNRGVSDAVERLARDIAMSLEEQEAYARKLNSHRARVPTGHVKSDKPNELIDALRQRLTDAAAKRLTKLVEGGTRPGAPLHDLARKVNRFLGKEPKAYVHINTASKLSKGLGAASFAIDVLAPVVDIGSVISDALLGQRIGRRRDEIRGGYAKHATAVVGEEGTRVRAHADAQIAPYSDAVSPQLQDAAAWRSARDTATEQLQAAREALAQATAAPA